MESRVRQLERDANILRLIATAARPPNKYRICNELPSKFGTEPTILAAVDSLEEAGLIEAIETVENARGGKPSKHYGLMLLGLKALIAAIRLLRPDIPGFGKGFTLSSLLQRYSAMVPEIFGSWDRYRFHQVEDLAQECLFDAVNLLDASEYAEWKSDLIRWRKERGSPNPADLRHGIVEGFFVRIDISALYESESWQRWLKAFKQDSELRRHYLSYLEEQKREQIALNEGIDRRIKSLQS